MTLFFARAGALLALALSGSLALAEAQPSASRPLAPQRSAARAQAAERGPSTGLLIKADRSPMFAPSRSGAFEARFTVMNAGSAPLSGLMLSVSGSSRARVVSNTCPATLAPRQKCSAVARLSGPAESLEGASVVASSSESPPVFLTLLDEEAR